VDWQETLGDLVAKLAGWLEAAVLLLPNFLVAVLIVVAFWLAAKLVRKVLRSLLRKTPAPRQIRGLLVNVVAVAVLVTGLFIALGVLELDKTVTSLLAGAGIIGLALGFAFQDMAANFMAGVYLAFARPIRVGDIIETNDFFGTVERIDLRSMRLRRPEGQVVLLPNKMVFENPLINYNDQTLRRVDLPVGVAYGDDLERAAEAARTAIEEVEGRDAGRPVELFYTEFGDSSINLVVRFWIPFSRQSEYLAARSEAIVRIKRAFDEAGITIPFPIRTLDFGVVGGERLAEALPAAWGGARELPPAEGGADGGGDGQEGR
jgi:small conductance mechanosensitive channel